MHSRVIQEKPVLTIDAQKALQKGQKADPVNHKGGLGHVFFRTKNSSSPMLWSTATTGDI
jgi:hypothetical protein